MQRGGSLSRPRVLTVGGGWRRRLWRPWRRGWLLSVCGALAVGAGAAWLIWRDAPTPPAGHAVLRSTAEAMGDAVRDDGSLRRSVRSVRLPDVPPLQASDGRVQRLHEVLFDGRAVVLTFMFSSCTTVCPVSNQTLVALEEALGADADRVRTVSLSIDPDHDTVRQMAAYARRSGRIGAFYTSDPGTSEAVQRAFDVWRGDKMNHPPVFLIGTGPDRPWVRLDGTASPRELLDELRRLGVLRS